MSKDLKEAIGYLKEHVDMYRASYVCGCIDRHHSCLRAEDPGLIAEICDLMEEWGDDHEMCEGWWCSEMDEEELFYALFD